MPVLSRGGLQTASVGSTCSGVTDRGQVWRYFLQGPRAQTGDSSPGDISVSCVLGYKGFWLLRPDVQTPWKPSKMAHARRSLDPGKRPGGISMHSNGPGTRRLRALSGCTL